MLRVMDLVSGDYYINVHPFIGTGTFTFNIAKYVPAPGDSPVNAIDIALGDTSGTLPGPASGGSIWYVIAVPAGDYQFSLTGPGGTDFDLDLYDSAIKIISATVDTTYPDILTVPGLLAGDYYINIQSFNGTGSFLLNIIPYIPTPGETPSTAITITLGDTSGTLLGPAEYGSIWYATTLAAGDYQFSLTGPEGTNFNLQLYDSMMGWIDATDDNIYPDILKVSGLLAGNYYINIQPFNGTGDFLLNIATYVPAPGETPGTALTTTLGDTSGTLPGPAKGGSIWYVITLPAGDYQFSLTGPGGTDFNLQLYDSMIGWVGTTEDNVYPDILKVPNLSYGRFIPGINLIYTSIHNCNGWYKPYTVTDDGTYQVKGVGSGYSFTIGMSCTSGSKLLNGHASYWNNPTTLYSSNVDGSGVNKIKSFKARAGPLLLADEYTIILAWLPNNVRVGDIHAINMDGSNHRVVIDDENMNFWEDCHPFDGQAFSMRSNRNADGNDHIFKINSDGTGIIQLTEGDYNDLGSMYSPNGQYIMYRRLPSDIAPTPYSSPYELVVRNVVVIEIIDLIDEVNTLVDDGILNKGQGNALVVKLETVLKKYSFKNPVHAGNQVNAFINQVTDLIYEGILTSAQANC